MGGPGSGIGSGGRRSTTFSVANDAKREEEGRPRPQWRPRGPTKAERRAAREAAAERAKVERRARLEAAAEERRARLTGMNAARFFVERAKEAGNGAGEVDPDPLGKLPLPPAARGEP